MGDMTKANEADVKYGVTLLALLMTALFLVAQPVRAETGENPLTSRAFWAEMKQTDNWQEIVQGHIDAGWDIQEVHPKNGTALHRAVVAGFAEALPVLIDDHRLDVNLTQSISKGTPLHYAVTYAKEEDPAEIKANAIKMAEFLINAGANMEAVDWNGDTPLHSAFGYGSVKTINFLIDAGASQTTVNHNNNTPFEMIQSGRGRPFWGSSFYGDHKDRFTDNLRLVWGDWENGKIILEESINGKLTKIEQED